MSTRPVVWFHVGAPKTGTTFLQRVMHEHRRQLRSANVLYPGTAPSQFWASLDLRESGFRGHHDPHVPGAWKRTVDEIKGWSGSAVIDHESFGQAGPDRIDRALGDLDFADVHIVYTARDLARQLPAAWQERIKNRSAETWTDFLESLRVAGPQRSSAAKSFWSSHGTTRLLARWSRSIAPDHVHVITVPPAGAGTATLWERFAGLVGIDAAAYSTEESIANTSIGATEAEVLRRFNAAIEDLDVPWPAYSAMVKHQIAPALGNRNGPRIELPQDAFDWAVDWSRTTVDDLTAANYDVVGDLTELVPAARLTGIDPDSAPAEDRAEVALACMVGLVGLALEGRTASAALRRSQRGAVARKAEEFGRRSETASKVRDAVRRWQGHPDS